MGWRAVEAQARGEDESAIEHHQIKCYLILTEPARKTARKVHFLSTERENSPGCCRDAEHREAKKWIFLQHLIDRGIWSRSKLK